MPKRTDIKKILIIGSGPIIISQACEFDYSGTQAVKALKEEGYEVVLVNSNPATIMTDPELADRTYIEPITPEVVAKIIAKERPDAILPTLGGQTGLNTAIKVAEAGVLDQYGVELLAADIEVIKKAEGRESFRAAMKKIGLKVPESAIVHTVDEARPPPRPSAFPSSSGRASPWAAPAAAWPTTGGNWKTYAPPASTSPSTPRSCWSAACSAGRSTNSR